MLKDFLHGKIKWLLCLAVLTCGFCLGNTNTSGAEPIPLRGIVEGFYGTPWTQEKRLDMLKFCADHKLNAYIYAPKDDPYHRAKWREPYPKDKLADLQVLVDTAKANNVRFIFAISPGLDIELSGYKGVLDRAAMEKKLTAMYELGVRDFAIFFDDIKNKDARGQAEFLNWVNEYFIAKHPDVSPLITVPTEYFRQDMVENGAVKKYTRDFSETLDKNIMVLYTGEKVVPDGLTDADYQAACSLYGRQLGIWWNYPVSDYLEAKLALGPVEKLPQTSVIPAIFFNPMKHAELSKISLATGADYAQNPGQYNARKSWQKALAEQYGRLAADMEAFADHSQHMVVSWAVIGPEDGAALRAVFNDYWQADNAARSSHKEKAIQELIKLDKSVAALQLQLTEKQLAECQPQLAQLRRIIKADLTGLAVLAGETDKKAVFKKEMQEVITHDKTERISETCVRAFLNELAEHIDGKKNNK
ncbi:MAG: beta-N-acetylglucosaminidase domain-containing protein [Selenomonas sp.]|nr:beta-N-acetylglucosaminidase domain-containing protein [Selenomonas sp.]